MIVVDKPFGGWGDGAPLVDCLGDLAMSLQQCRSIVGKPPHQRRASRYARGHRLCDCETSCMLLEALHTEKLFPNGLAVIPWQLWLRASEDTLEKRYQNDLSTARSRSDHFTSPRNKDTRRLL